MAPEKERDEKVEELPSPASGLAVPSDLGDEESEAMEPLVHPMPSMQGAFEESIMESTEESELPTSPVEPDAQTRRHRVLESKHFDDSWTSRWKQSSTAQYHPLVKLMAQIVFGMHLLQQQQAKSEKEVVKILQTHVNEVDTFLERTSEDFEVAIKDIEDRIRYLKLPMAHMDVFETMLNDKKFRTQLLVGNEKIEKIIERTTRAMNGSLLDVEKGVQANKELGRYMKSVQNFWPQEQRAICDVFGAMRGNEHGWRRYLRDLQLKANNLARIVGQLQRLIGDMSRMAAAASRRNKTQSSTVSSEPKPAPSTPGPRSKFSEESQPPALVQSSPRSSNSLTTNLNKPLPQEPQSFTVSRPDSTPKPHPVPFADRFERPRQSPPDPSTPPRTSATLSIPRPRPKTAGEARAADSRVNPSELLEFFQRPDPLRSNPNPLRSNPPDTSRPQSDDERLKQKLGRSQSHGANLLLSTVEVKDEGAKVTRSRSQGAIDVLTIPSAPSVNKASSVQQTSTTPPKPLSSSGTREGSVRPSSEQTEKKDAMRGTGFARRLSKRLKHLPVTIDAPPAYKKQVTAAKPTIIPVEKPVTAPENAAALRKDPPPPDSAYHSLKEKDSPPNGLSGDMKTTRPESVVGPLPFENQLAHSSEPSHPFGSSSERNAPSVKSLASGKSRSMSVRNLFRSKWRKEKMVPA